MLRSARSYTSGRSALRLVMVAAVIGFTLTSAAQAAVLVGIHPSLDTARAGAVNVPNSRFTFFVEQPPPNVGYVVPTQSAFNGWKHALRLDIHNAGLETNKTGIIRDQVEIGDIAPDLAADGWVGWELRLPNSPNWEFTGTGGVYVPSSTPIPVSGLTSEVSADGDTLRFFFNPLPEGMRLTIEHGVRYVGPTIAPGEQFNIPLDAVAYVYVPEPATATTVACLAGLLLGRRRR